MRSCLVTGGAGFIGSHLAGVLAGRGDAVTVYDDLSTGSAANLEGIEARLIEGDVRDAQRLRHAMEGANLVFHLAAFVSVPASLEEPVRCNQINLNGSLNVLRAARELGVRRVVLASSAAIYGDAEQVVGEDRTPQPHSPYAASKLAMEAAARMFTERYGLETVCLRFFNVYGPRQPRHSAYAAVIPEFIHCLLSGTQPTVFGTGSQSRDFVYVGDVARASLLAAEASGASGQVFNIGSGQATSLLELLAELRALVSDSREPAFGPSRTGDIHFSQAEIRLASETLGFQPGVELDRGLRQTVDWIRETIHNPQVQA